MQLTTTVNCTQHHHYMDFSRDNSILRLGIFVNFSSSDDSFKAELFIIEKNVSYGPGLPQEVRLAKHWSCLDFAK